MSIRNDSIVTGGMHRFVFLARLVRIHIQFG